jgi:hypothetical protein
MVKGGRKQRKVKKVKHQKKARPNGKLTKELMKICIDKIAEQITSSKEERYKQEDSARLRRESCSRS